MKAPRPFSDSLFLRRMNLARRLTLSFIGVVVVSATLVGLVSSLATQRLFAGYLAGQRDARLEQVQATLAGYYAANGSWEGVQTMMSTPGWGGLGRMGFGRYGGWPGGPPHSLLGSETLTLADRDGRVVATLSPEGGDAPAVGTVLSRAVINAGRPILVDGQRVPWSPGPGLA